MPYAFTNVFVSGILFGGKPNQTLNARRSGKIELVVFPAILD